MKAAHLGNKPVDDRLGLKKALDKPRASNRPVRRRVVRETREMAPAEPRIVVPETGAILRMICATPLERDTLDLRLALMDLAGVHAVGIDLATGVIDLEIGAEVTVPNHVLGLASSRCRLPVVSAELHERVSGYQVSDATLIATLR
ncbi:MAG: hypothetical protein ACKVVP_23605 [Chloroflexota bacterium]